MAELTEQQKVDRVLRTKLRELYASTRSDAKLFAVLTVLLTPLAVALFILMLLFVLAFVDLPVIDHLGYRLSFVTGVNLCLAFMIASYFLRPKEQYQRQDDDTAWLVAAGGLFCCILTISYATPLSRTHPGWFWPSCLLLALAMLGCVGHAYEPKDDYYLGWTAGPFLIDNPFTIQDDIDRAHMGLGFVVSISHLILSSYGEIFGSRWLWRGMGESELSTSVTLLRGLATRDTSEAMAHVRALARGSAADSVRALVKLELVVIDKGFPRLSRKGREFLDLGPISRLSPY
ncbi:hypothetical protein F6V30_09295 [Oryzomonas sagensis]|uniref:Uncharacterized protein n=1 Tax=Oryzomonas sagensis TaxID=2603857 RepID=A0ABQ6TPQ3_9BACT|nr:hypothetical protein [Oryzomonas sagensis]KAB0670337.1 hypothetical protein F6V30_09295 [Oryzomonas sagensis]